MSTHDVDRPMPGLGEAVRVWARIAALSFGGPAGQIAVMHRILVEEKRWIGDDRFLQALNFCMLLPGPEAQQLATYLGWLMHRVKGGLIAGGLFILPGAVAMLALSLIYARYGQVGPVAALFFGLKAAVLAIVVQAVVRIGSRALGNAARVGLAAAAFVAIFALGLPFPLIVLAAGLIGWLSVAAGSNLFDGAGHGAASGARLSDADSVLGAGTPAHARPEVARPLATAALWLALWLGPVAALAVALPDSVFAQIADFFARMAVVTFGGAYAVLAYVAQAAVEHYGWLRPGEMLDGLGLAETTPGPLIMVTQFVGFLGAWRAPGGLSPWEAGVLGALLTTWVTFCPCFLWIFAGGPYIERLRSNRHVAAALSAITAAVVGVILNLAAWFAVHFVFGEVGAAWGGLPFPVLDSLDSLALVLSVACLALAFLTRIGVVWLLVLAAGTGVALHAGGFV